MITRGYPPDTDTGSPDHRGLFRRPCFWLGAAVFLAALGLRLAYIHEYTNRIGINYYTFDQTDNHTFHQWARNIANGDWLCRNQIHPYHNWTARVAPAEQWEEWYGGKTVYHQSPLYPYLVAVVYRLFGPEAYWIRLFQAVMGAFTCLLVFLTARLYFGRWTALAAGLIISFSGFHFYYDAFILREGLVTFLLAAFVYLGALAFKRGSFKLLVLAGVALGMNVLAKPIALTLLPLYLAACFVFFKGGSPGRRLVRAAVFAFAFFLPLVPVYLRNAYLDSPTFKISTRGPTAFINGNLRNQEGTDWSPPPRETRAILRDANYKLTATVAETLKSYMDHPPAYAALLWDKTCALFNSFEIPNNTNYYLIRWVSDTLHIGFVSFWFLAPAALLGMLLLLPRIQQIWQLYLVGLLVALGTIAFFIVARFRQPLVPILALFAGYSTIWVLKKLAGRRWAALIPALAVFLLLLRWTDHEELTYDSRLSACSGVMLKLAAQQELTMAERYKDYVLAEYRRINENRYYPDLDRKLDAIEEAFRAFNRATLYRWEDARKHLHLAQGYLALIDTTRRSQLQEYMKYTADAVERALALDPGLPGAHKCLGICLIKQAERIPGWSETKRYVGEAFRHLKAELLISPEDPECLKGVGFIYYVLGNLEEAARYYKKYLEIADQRDYEIESQLARIRYTLESGNPEIVAAALEMTEEAYAFDPRDARFGRNYSDALYLSGKVEEAIRILEKLKRIDPFSRQGYDARIENFRRLLDRRLQEGRKAEDGGNQQEKTQDKPMEEAGF